jgi:hypothetical protein
LDEFSEAWQLAHAARRVSFLLFHLAKSVELAIVALLLKGEWMKKLVLIAVFILSASAFGQTQKVSFTHFGQSGRNQSYYACSYVEAQAYSYLELLGVSGARVRCYGGIMPGSYRPQSVSVVANFDLPVISGVEEVIEIRGESSNPACGLNTQMIREFIKVMPHVEILNKSDSCAFHNSNFFYRLKILR